MLPDAVPFIIDAHAHVWSADDGERFPMREKIAALQRDFPATELQRLQDGAGVTGSVLIQAVASATESRRLLALAASNSRILGVVCWLDVADPAHGELLAEYGESPAFVGVRPMPADTFGSAWLTADCTSQALRSLRAADCTVDFLLPVDALGSLRAVVREHPGLRCVLDHCGRPAVMAGVNASWREEMRLLARETDIAVKCSGLAERAGVEWTRESLKPWVGYLLEAFGTGRVMFASNWPILTLAADYGLWVRTMLGTLQELGLSATEVADVMSHTASRFYQLSSATERMNSSSPHKEISCR